MDIYGPYMAIYGPYMAIYGPYMAIYSTFFATLETAYLDFSPPKLDSDGLETNINISFEFLHIPASATCQTELVVQVYGDVNPSHPDLAVKIAVYCGS